jgi:endonuclease/exonuclease/phosphatase family metal-dependent hydrolase
MRPTLVVVTANAASGLDRRTGRVDIGGWADAAADLRADVLAVQEVDHLLDRTGQTDQTDQIAARLSVGGPSWVARFAAAVHGEPGSHRTMRPAAATGAEEPSYGIALFSRHPVLWWRELRMAASRAVLPVPLPSGAPRRLLLAPDEQRVAIAAAVDTGVGRVTVVGTHLSFAPWHAARQLRELVRWAHDLPRPVVLLGDLNLPGTLPARLTGWPLAMRAPTYPANRPRLQLDHVLLDAGTRTLRVVDSRTERLAGGDHRAARVELAAD